MAARRVDAKPVPRIEYVGRWKKAQERLEAMDRELKEGAVDPALILSIQAAIAACDALTIYHMGARCSSVRHLDAVECLRGVKGLEGLGHASHHLSELLHGKGDIEYSNRSIHREDANRLIEHARRFAEFVRKNLPPQL